MSDMRDDIASVLLSAEEIQARTAELGAQISRDFDGREPLFVGVLKGCFVFMADLMRSVTIPCSVDFMAVSSYGNQTTTTGAVKINKDLNQDIEGRDIILVEDILDSGVTLHYLADYLSVRRPASITIATLLDKPARRKAPIHATYAGFEVPDAFVVGYGLDYAEKYRKPVFAAVSNMSIAVERRDFLRFCSCFVCNQQEAGILFSEDYDSKTPEELRDILAHHVQAAEIPRMVVTMGAQGAVYAMQDGSYGICPAGKVDVKDTTGAGDAFFAGATIGLTYGKTLAESCEIGTRLAASTICTSGNVCPRFLPEEFGLNVAVTD